MRSYIKSIGTGLPVYYNHQQELVRFMADGSGMTEEERGKLELLYKASGIHARYSVLADFGKQKGAFTFFPNTENMEPSPSTGERMQVYRREALPLALKAVHNCIKGYSSRQTKEITHIITVSCTGMYAPGLDIELIEALELPTSTQRYNINFMGCYAAFNGLKLADAICKSTPDALVLMVCVELCTIHYQKSKNYDQWVSNALFGDGAAAVLLDSKRPSNEKALSLENFYCDIAPEGKDEMAWHIGNTGFEMILSSYVPSLVRLGIKQLANALLLNAGCGILEVGYFAIHPGGKKILKAVEDALGIQKEDNRFAYEVLKKYGNMSSPTVLFVLSSIFEQLTSADHDKTILSVAFGPGLTMESMLLKTACFNSYDEDIHQPFREQIPNIV